MFTVGILIDPAPSNKIGVLGVLLDDACEIRVREYSQQPAPE